MNLAIEIQAGNYYSLDVDREYMSASQFKKFMQCEAATMAELNGEWQEEPSDAMLVGSYVHAALESEEAFLQFVAEHRDEIYNRKGDLYAPFKQADAMINTLKDDPFIAALLQGQHEQVIVAEFAGAKWKAKLDVYNPVGRIVDVKTVKSINEKVWNNEDKRYMSWVEAYGYARQLALYTELERIWSGRDERLTALIIAVTKEDPPDKEVISIPEDAIEEQLEFVKAVMPRILAVKNGEVEPMRCETCKYCRSTKKVKRIVDYRDILV
jgi:hypothetical protein